MADRYAVGTGSWTAINTAIWSATDGGATGASVPTLADNVFFTANTGTITLTGTTVCNCNNFDRTGHTGTITHGSGVFLNIYGNLVAGSGGTWNVIGTAFIKMRSTTTGKTVTFNGKLPNIEFDGVGGAWQIQDAYAAPANGVLRLTNGSLDTNGQTLNFNTGTFESNNTNTRTLTLDASTITLGATGSINIDGTNLTFSGASSAITSAATTGTVTLNLGGLTWGSLSCTSITTGSLTVTGNNTFSTVTLGNGASIDSAFYLAGNQTISTLNISGNSAVNRPLITSSVPGTQRTLTVATLGTTANFDLQDIVGAGAASWDFSAITTIGDYGNNSGITFTAPVNLYWVPSGGTSTGITNVVTRWATSSGGTAGTGRIPLAHDSIYFDANSIDAGGRTITHALKRVNSINWTGATNNPVLARASSGNDYGGDVTLISGMTTTGSGAFTFSGRAAQTFTHAGINIPGVINVNNGSNTVTVTAGYTSTNALIFTTGNLSASDVTASSISVLNGSGVIQQLTLSGNITYGLGGGDITLNGDSSISGLIFNAGATGELILNNADLAVSTTMTLTNSGRLVLTDSTITSPNHYFSGSGAGGGAGGGLKLIGRGGLV